MAARRRELHGKRRLLARLLEDPLVLRATSGRVEARGDAELDREVAREQVARSGFLPEVIQLGALARLLVVGSCGYESLLCVAE